MQSCTLFLVRAILAISRTGFRSSAICSHFVARSVLSWKMAESSIRDRPAISA